jgi:type IV pilus assembly protein PilY1
MFEDEPRQVLVFGGGYYGGWADTDSDGVVDTRVGYDKYDMSTPPDLSAATGRGNAIYIVDAETGELLWKAMDNGSSGTNGGTAVLYDDNGGLNHSIAAEIAVVDSNDDNIDDRAYVADLGGNVWRIDLPRNTDFVSDSDNRDDWQLLKIAALGDTDANGGSDDRRFFHKIDVVFADDPDASPGAFDALVLGSGDREHPKVNDVDNYFFVVKDPFGGTVPLPSAEAPFAIGDLANADCFLVFDAPTSGCTNADDLRENGWKIALTDPGEKVLASSLTNGGNVFFSSYLPEGGSVIADECQSINLGSGRGYTVDLFNGRPVFNQNAVDDNANDTATSRLDRYEDSSWGEGIPTEYQSLGGDIVMGRPGTFLNANVASYYRTFWYEKEVDH